MKKIIAVLLILSAGFGALFAQELDARVQVNTDKIGGTDKAVYENFRLAITEFLNTRSWCNAPLSRNERIECTFLFIFGSTDGSTHTVEMQVQSRRPVFNTTYMTPMLNVRQVVEFDYQEGQSLEFNPNQVNDNLTATLAFWIYLILGMDFDSFALYGGQPFFDAARDIVSQAQGTLGENWKAHSDDKNFWGWSDALSREEQKPLRELNYRYHRLGLDVMYDKPDEGRKVITEGFALLRPIRDRYPRSPLLGNFSDAKLSEWIQLYSKASMDEKQQAYDRLMLLYPGQSSRLEAILE